MDSLNSINGNNSNGAVQTRVMVVENNDNVSATIVGLLAVNGYLPIRYRRGADALARHPDADVMLLDLTLPDIDGLDLLRRLRGVSAIPALALASDNDEHTVVRALRAGADDCLVKPLRLAELLARIEALTRRRTAQHTWRRTVRVEDISIDLDARAVWLDTTLIALTAKEFDLLAVLARNLGRVVSREQITAEVWGIEHPAASRALDVHMTSLRAKLDQPKSLRTIRRVGYRLG
jgi:DNA-binding response OmpR family regulator